MLNAYTAFVADCGVIAVNITAGYRTFEVWTAMAIRARLAHISKIADVTKTIIWPFTIAVTGTDIFIKMVQAIALGYLTAEFSRKSIITLTDIPINTRSLTGTYRRVFRRDPVTLNTCHDLLLTKLPGVSLLANTYVLHDTFAVVATHIRFTR